MTAWPWVRMTVDEFRRWPGDGDTPWDLIDGEPVMQAAASPELGIALPLDEVCRNVPEPE